MQPGQARASLTNRARSSSSLHKGRKRKAPEPEPAPEPQSEPDLAVLDWTPQMVRRRLWKTLLPPQTPDSSWDMQNISKELACRVDEYHLRLMALRQCPRPVPPKEQPKGREPRRRPG